MQQALKKEELYTYADYLTWDDDERWEIINGIAYDMSPAPTTKHQLISVELTYQIKDFFKKTNSPCVVFHAPFDVRLPEQFKRNDKIVDVVQPDLAVICDQYKIDEKGCHGAPTFIIEILSPYTASKDKEVKLKLYEKNSVKEYWLIDQSHNTVIVYLLERTGHYGKPSIHIKQGALEVKSLEGLIIDLDLVFQPY
jgi:Uma2 family endonuclease